MPKSLIAKQILDFQKSTFDCSYNSLSVLQQQMEGMIQSFIEKSSWLPPESKTALKDWENAYSQGRNDFKEIVDNNYQMLGDYFSQGEMSSEEEKPKM
ncbi:MAG: hypothetical protein ABFD50_07745 [Smithella sp.]